MLDPKASLARGLAAPYPGTPAERARRVVDDLIRDDLVAEFERLDWVRKITADLERAEGGLARLDAEPVELLDKIGQRGRATLPRPAPPCSGPAPSAWPA